MLVFAYLLALAGAANAAAAPGDSAATAEKKICKREIATGSVMPKKVCRSQAEWNALTAQGQSDLDRVRDMERSRSMVGGNR